VPTAAFVTFAIAPESFVRFVLRSTLLRRDSRRGAAGVAAGSPGTDMRLMPAAQPCAVPPRHRPVPCWNGTRPRRSGIPSDPSRCATTWTPSASPRTGSPGPPGRGPPRSRDGTRRTPGAYPRDPTPRGRGERVVRPTFAGEEAFGIRAGGPGLLALSLDDGDPLAELDGRYLSTEVAGGFTGRVIGMYVTEGSAAFDRHGPAERSSSPVRRRQIHRAQGVATVWSLSLGCGSNEAFWVSYETFDPVDGRGSAVPYSRSA
jgi:hypothetical protein